MGKFTQDQINRQAALKSLKTTWRDKTLRLRPAIFKRVLPQLHLKKVDVLTDARLDTLTQGSIKSAQWRVATTKGSFQRWASGADETVATRIAIARINKTKDLSGRKSLARELNRYRMDNSQHIWTTSDNQISGHVPAIKSDMSNMNRSVTKEHGTRDRLREKVVLSVFDQGPDARRVAGTAATIKHFMSPGEELLTAKPNKPTFANYTGLGDLQDPKELRKLASHQQEVREHHKIQLAEFMWSAGRKSEVPDNYHKFVGQGHDPATVRGNMVAAMHDKTIATNNATSSQADMSVAGPGRLKRSLSFARLPIY